MSQTMSPAPRTAPPRWPWVLGAVLLVVGCVIVFSASFVLSIVAGQITDSRETRVVESVVLDLDDAYLTADCEAFEALVDADLADSMFDGHFDCDAFEEVADSLAPDGTYDYSVEVLSSHVRGSTAVVQAEESHTSEDGDRQVDVYEYTLKRSDGRWIIVGYDRV